MLAHGGVIGPDERLPWPQTAVMGVQHVVAMFGATVVALLLMGFNPNIAILMSGIGTLIFFIITGGKVPRYLESSFAFIGVVIAASAYAGKGPNANLGVALGGIIACGVLYTLIGAVVQAVGTGWIERFMPPVVTGSVVAVIGLNLASIPVKNMAASNFDAWMQVVTFVSVAWVAVMTRATGVTTYAENIGVMAATMIYSTAVFVVAALIAVVLGFSPKFGALIHTIRLPVMGGVSIVVFGLIAIVIPIAKIWVDNKVNFSVYKNLWVAAITVVLGTGDFTLKFGQFALGGIGTATFGAILLYALLNRKISVWLFHGPARLGSPATPAPGQHVPLFRVPKVCSRLPVL